VSLVFVKQLASGSFGMVEHQEIRRNDVARKRGSCASSVAVKTPLGDVGERLIHNEGGILRELKHDGIVRLEAIVSDGNGGHKLVEEYLEGPSLQGLLSRQRKCTPHKRLYTHQQGAKWMLQLASALAYMHSRPGGRALIHRDVSIDNTMLTSFNFDKADLKLIDFGLACNLHNVDGHCSSDVEQGDHPATQEPSKNRRGPCRLSSREFIERADVQSLSNNNNVCGTFLHMAPEVVTSDTYDEKVDIFSLGMVMFQIFSYTSMVTVLHQSGFTIKDGQAAIVGGWRPPLHFCGPLTVSNLIERCWSPDPELRPTAEEVTTELMVFLAAEYPHDKLNNPGILKRFLKSVKSLARSAKKKSLSSRRFSDPEGGPGPSTSVFDSGGRAGPFLSRRRFSIATPSDRAAEPSAGPPSSDRGSSHGSTSSENNKAVWDEVARTLGSAEITPKIAKPLRKQHKDKISEYTRNDKSSDFCRYAI